MLFIHRYNKRRTRAASTRTTAIPRGSGNGTGADHYSPHGSVENGCDSSPTATQAPSNGVNGSARSSPHYVSGMNGLSFCAFYAMKFVTNHALGFHSWTYKLEPHT